MIGALVLRHEILRNLAKLLLISVALAMFVMNIAGFVMARNGTDAPMSRELQLLVQVVLLAGAGALLFKDAAGRRCRIWGAGLPVAGSALWASHALAVLTASLVLVLAVAAAIVAFGAALSRLMDLPGLDPSLLPRLLARPLGLAMLSSGLVAAWRPHLAEPGRAADWARYRASVLVGLVLLLLVLTYVPTWVAVVPALGGIAAALAGRRRVPEALEWSAGGPDGAPGTAAAAAAWTRTTTRRRRAHHRLILRSLFKWPMAWIVGLPFAFLLGMLLGGLDPSPDGDTDLRLMNIVLCSYLLFAFTGHFMENLHRVDHLPIDRRLMLRWLMLPGLLAMFAGYGTSRVGGLGASAPAAEAFAFVDEEDGYGLKIPPVLFDLAVGDDPVPITAPWGESHPAESVPVVAGGPWRLVKPYSTPAGSSRDFVAWQLSRAVADLYGVTIAPDSLAARYLRTDVLADRVVLERDLTPNADYGPFPAPDEGPVFPVLGGFVTALLLVVSAIYFTASRPGTTLVRSRVVFWALMVLLLALNSLDIVLFVTGASHDWILSGVVFGTIRRLGTSGVAGVVVTWVAAAVLVALSWRLAERRLLAAEAIRSPDNRL